MTDAFDASSPIDRNLSARPAARPEWPYLAGVAALALATYVPVVRAGFVFWDDPANIVDNPHIRAITPQTLAWMWSARHLGVYEPLSWMLKAATYAVAGPAAWAYHLVSWFLHAANAALVFLIASRLVEFARRTIPGTPRVDRASDHEIAALAAVLFAVHPLRAECVAWASAQSYLLAAAFALLAIRAYVRACETQPADRRWMALAFVAYAGSLLSKTAAVPLPLILLVLDVYPLRRIGGDAGWWSRATRPVWVEKLIFAIPAAATAWLVATTPVTSVIDPSKFSWTARPAFAAYGVVFYIWKTLWPAALSPFYPVPEPFHWSARFVAFLVLAIVLTAAAIACHRRWPALTAAWAAYLIWLAPVSGLVRHGDQLAADRYAYLATIGPLMVLAAAVTRLRPMMLRRGIAAIACVVLAALAWRQCGIWADSVRLWSRAVAVDPGNWLAHNNLANALLAGGDDAAAQRHVEHTLRLRPDYPDALCTRAVLAERAGRIDAAITDYRRAIELVPFHPASINLSGVLRDLGRVDEAIAVAEAGVRADPAMHDLKSNLALMLLDRGEAARAEALLRELVAAVPHEPRYRFNLAIVFAAHGRSREAIEQLEVVVRSRPNDTRAANKLAWILATAPDDAVRDPARAIRISAALCESLQYQNADALDTFAAALAATGAFDEAVRRAEQAIQFARQRGDARLEARIAERLAGYRRRSPFRDRPPLMPRPYTSP